MPFNYELRCLNQELEIYEIIKKNENKRYILTKKPNGGGWYHTCKAITVYGPEFLCRHKKLILAKYYAADEYKYLFNISPRKSKGKEK